MRLAQDRAARLLRCYPASWRERYGDEFAQLLIDDISERPRSFHRTVDVVRGGCLARCSGFQTDALDPLGRRRASLAATAAALVTFLVAGIAVWSQLTIGWQWSAPSAPAIRVAMVLMSAALLGLLVLGALAAIPLLGAGLRALIAGELRPRIGPLLLSVGGAAVLWLGSRHFGHGWPGTGGHAWTGRGLVPGPVAAFCWAATLWVSSYWAHPGSLLAFPAGEIGWMAISPLALAAILFGAARALGGLRLSSRILRYETAVALLAATAMAVFLAGAGSWMLSGGPAPHGLFRVGAIDFVALAVMAVALLAAIHAVRASLGHDPPHAT